MNRLAKPGWKNSPKIFLTSSLLRIRYSGASIPAAGYSLAPPALSLKNKQHLGLHTKLLSDGIVELMKMGVIDNLRENIDRGKSVATFCMGVKSTYDFLDDNPAVDFRTIEYTNGPIVIARHENMVSINSALEIDLTGQATAESIGKVFYSGVGGQADFMRGCRNLWSSITHRRW